MQNITFDVNNITNFLIFQYPKPGFDEVATMYRLKQIYEALERLEEKTGQGVSARELGDFLKIDRTTASRYLNDLERQGKVVKIPGKPVKYKTASAAKTLPYTGGDFSLPPESQGSLQPIVEAGLAALLYPGKSLPILLTGETGTGKTHLAETLSKLISEKANRQIPFIVFNCADYAHNSELLVGQIFGIKKGAFTGATEDKMGLVEQADGGILFLDEIHRLPPSGQEMLFYLMDKGVYRRLGETTKVRKANVTLVGATTEDPGKVLLPALLRRFSVKLHLPPLRERTAEERKALIDHFLREEAGKMNADIAITDPCRQAFLTYPCPGNIGQLKSDIQIACANAYLRYLTQKADRVTITEEDLPETVKEGIPDHSSRGRPMRTINVNRPQRGEFVFPNIYQRLRQASRNPDDKERVEKVIRSYIRELSEKYPGRATDKSWKNLIDEDLLGALKEAKTILAQEHSIRIDMNQLYVIGLHLQNYRIHFGHESPNEALPVIQHPDEANRLAANKLAECVQKRTGMLLPREEIELIAYFLNDGRQEAGVPEEQKIAVILVTHGESTASSMADMTNALLGSRVIHAVDMPLDVSYFDIYEKVKQLISGLSGVKGVLLLVDIGSLITMGDKLKHEFNLPILTLPGVNLAMALEAGRMSLVPDMSLEDVYQAAKRAMSLMLEKDIKGSGVNKRRMIATVCFTGEGAAQLLETWLENHLSSLDEDVLIRPVRIDPITKDTSVLHDLKKYYDVIAIIGTVPVSFPGIPYIPAWELLKQEGISRLTKLLEVTRPAPKMEEQREREEEEDVFQLIVRGLGEIVTCVNPKSITSLLKECMPAIKAYYSWDPDRELGMWMHIGGLIDRIISARIQNQEEQLVKNIPIDRTVAVSEEEAKVWEPLLKKIEKTFHIRIPELIKKELVRLSR